MTTTKSLPAPLPAVDFAVESRKSTMGSAAKRGLRLMLIAATDGRCALCGDVLNLAAPQTAPDRCDMSHVVPASMFTAFDVKERPGFLSHNIFAGCGRCQDWTADRDLTPVYNAGGFAIPEGVIAWDRLTAGRVGRANPPARGVDADRAAFYAHLDTLL